MPWKLAEPTPSSHSIAIPASALIRSEVKSGDILAAFDESGNCFGIMQWQGQTATLTLFGDDPITESKDGFFENELFRLKGYRPETGEEFILGVTFDLSLPNVYPVYVTNGLSAIYSIELVPSGVTSDMDHSSVLLIPNPAKDKIRVIIEDNGFVNGSLLLIGSDGRSIKKVSLGINNSVVDISNLNAGIYIVQISYGTKTIYKRLVKH